MSQRAGRYAIVMLGGNVAYLDGSVVWRNLKEMGEHQTYSHGKDKFRGMW